MNKRPANRLTRQEFYQITEALRNGAEDFLKRCNSSRKAAAWIEEKTGLAVAKSTAIEAVELVGLKMEKRAPQSNNARTHRKNVAILARSVATLYKKLGEPVPEDLQDLLDRVKQHLPEEKPADTAREVGIPASSITPSQRIPVVTPNNRPNERR